MSYEIPIEFNGDDYPPFPLGHATVSRTCAEETHLRVEVELVTVRSTDKFVDELQTLLSRYAI